jgi:hypothetical protein
MTIPDDNLDATPDENLDDNTDDNPYDNQYDNPYDNPFGISDDKRNDNRRLQPQITSR